MDASVVPAIHFWWQPWDGFGHSLVVAEQKTVYGRRRIGNDNHDPRLAQYLSTCKQTCHHTQEFAILPFTADEVFRKSLV